MEYYVDYSYNSINKFGEELCGELQEVPPRERRGRGRRPQGVSTLSTKAPCEGAFALLKKFPDIVGEFF